MLYSAAPVPVIVGVVKVAFTVPSFVTVTDRIFVDGFATIPKANDPVTFISVPVPVTFITSWVTPFGSPENVAVTVPGIAPSVEPGLKARLNVHVAFVISVVAVLQPPLLMPRSEER